MIGQLKPDERHELLKEKFHLTWDNAYERGQGMYDFFIETMQFNREDVKQCNNFNKQEIIEELIGL